jgi:hypothetical protein
MDITGSGVVSTLNSSEELLDPGGINVFTGTAEDLTLYGTVLISVYSDVASATDGLSIEYSSDGTNWDHDDNYTVPAATGKNYSVQRVAQYFRVVYTNGAVIQTEFRLQVIFNQFYIKPSSHNIKGTISGDDDAELMKSVITGEDPAGTFQNVKSTVDGVLKTSDESDGLSIAKGNVTGTSFIHKFGNAPDFDTVDSEVTVWDGAEDGAAWELMGYTYSTTADIDSVSSSDAGDTQTVFIEGLDVNYNVVTQQKTLTGQTRAALDTPLIRVYRAFNDNGTVFAGHIVIYVNTALTAGVPTDKTQIRAVIHPDEQQTLMAVYTIPAGKTGYLRDWYVSTSGGSKASNYVFKVIARDIGGVFRTRHKMALEALSPIPYQHSYTEPEVFAEKTDIEMRVESIATPASTGNAVSAGFDIVLVDN